MKKIIKSLLVPAIFAAGTASALELELRDDSIMKDVELLEKKIIF